MEAVPASNGFPNGKNGPAVDMNARFRCVKMALANNDSRKAVLLLSYLCHIPEMLLGKESEQGWPLREAELGFRLLELAVTPNSA